MKPVTLRRREFLGAAATAAAFTLVPRHVLGGPRQIPPSEKMNIAGIGVGGMGASNLRNLETETIVALCDVDHAYAAKTFTRYPNATRYKDFREMLDREKGIDGVVVATPDHTHAVISMAAMKAGKHVYCQKPLTHDVYEARMLAQAAREAKVATQMGIQGHSDEGVRLICEWIWAGLIGEIREVDAWCSLSYYPWGHAGWSSKYSATEGHAAPPADARLGPLDRPGPDAAVSRGVSPGRVAVLVGLRLRHDGRPRGAFAGPGLLGPETRTAHERGGHLLRQHEGSASALGDRDVPLPRAATCRRSN